MKTRKRGAGVLGQLRTLYNIGTISDLTDGQLLERFATDADELAELEFAALFERHEAMVWRVCLAILRDEHAAEDAFQATFLVLVRKARSLWVRDSLGPWLHQVACRTACCLRRSVIRQRIHEQRCAVRDSSRDGPVETPGDPELTAAVHEEVNRLPEKYRAPLVLCDLQGRTHQEAAQCLGWPIGTVKSRQSQGRGLIRNRLVRRGWGVSLAGVIAESLRETAVAATPIKVSRSAVLAAMHQSARLLTGFKISAHVLTLTQGVVRAMLWTKLRFLTIVSLAVMVASGGATLYVRGSQEPEQKANPPASKPLTAKTPKAPQATNPKNAAEQPATATPREQLHAQKLAIRKAKARYEIAKATRELAEIAVEEYGVLNYPNDLASVEGEIKLAESDLARSMDRLEYAKRLFEKKKIPQSEVQAEELNVQRAKFSLEQAQSKKMVLVDYTKSKNIKERLSEVEKARSDELAKQATWDLEVGKEKAMERELLPKKK